MQPSLEDTEDGENVACKSDMHFINNLVPWDFHVACGRSKSPLGQLGTLWWPSWCSPSRACPLPAPDGGDGLWIFSNAYNDVVEDIKQKDGIITNPNNQINAQHELNVSQEFPFRTILCNTSTRRPRLSRTSPALASTREHSKA